MICDLAHSLKIMPQAKLLAIFVQQLACSLITEII